MTVSAVKTVAGEWHGTLRGPEGAEVPFRLTIAEDGFFESAEGEPARGRYRGKLVVRDGQLVWPRARSRGR